ncbi:hypothetical protein CVT26_001263 [Gymnopilus dilepis]|uniref:Nucleoplasmin-like domain-containing protein n=1 Tax=Gymnopilus dilepis TaxID=231916 RepID=A0A409WEL1_9AGAR|nr:hypothetical protein CVT26_001263 [Gymnopilus dilepis]
MSDMQATGLWSLLLEPKKGIYVEPGSHLRVTNVALAFQCTDVQADTRLIVGYVPGGSKSGEKIRTVVANFTVAYTEQVRFTHFDLSPNTEYYFEADGPNPIQLLGYYSGEVDSGTGTTRIGATSSQKAKKKRGRPRKAQEDEGRDES